MYFMVKKFWLVFYLEFRSKQTVVQSKKLMTKCKTKLKMWHPHSTKINKTYGFKNDQVCHMNPSKDLPSNEFNEVFE
jgi:hypothetical protein